MQLSRAALLTGLVACSSSKCGSIVASGPKPAMNPPAMRRRMKFVWYGRLRSSQGTCDWKGER